jgi:hypothetical protein
LALTFSGSETSLPSGPNVRDTSQANGRSQSTVLDGSKGDATGDSIMIQSDSGQPLLANGNSYSLYVSLLDANDAGNTDPFEQGPVSSRVLLALSPY